MTSHQEKFEPETDAEARTRKSREGVCSYPLAGLRDLLAAFARPTTTMNAALSSYFASQFTGVQGTCTFEVKFPSHPVRKVGTGQSKFRITASTADGAAALHSLDELRICEAYMAGDIDIDGDMLSLLSLRAQLTDWHPATKLFSRLSPTLFGQLSSDRKWIAEHYEMDAEFYLLFLDSYARCYSHGYFLHDDETLEIAMKRKLDTALRDVSIEPGSRVLDIGAGWGAFVQHAGRQGVRVTSLTISEASLRYVNDLIVSEGLPCRVLLEHFMEHQSAEPYDAIVNFGVTEHLPDYAATLRQYQRLLRPGGRIFIDTSAAREKHPFKGFIQKHIWPGNHVPVQLSAYLAALERTPLELVSLRNDRWNYMLTARHWAERLDRNRDTIARRWGEPAYRRFRLYLWGCVSAFFHDDAGAYRFVLEMPSIDRRFASVPQARLSSLFTIASRLWQRTLGLGV